MKNNIYNSILAFCLIFSLALVSGCKGKTPEELEVEAQALHDQATELWRIGKEKEAFPLYDKIAKDYPESQVAKDLQSELTDKGLSYGSVAISWTVLRLYEIQNLLQELYLERGEYPETLETGVDAWDTRITYKLFPIDKVDFDFWVSSAGPDKKFNTGDDLKVVHAVNPDLKKQFEANQGKGEAGKGGKASRAGARGEAGQGTGEQKGSDDLEADILSLEQNLDDLDSEVSLDELDRKLSKKIPPKIGKKMKKGKSAADAEVELDDLLGGKF